MIENPSKTARQEVGIQKWRMNKGFGTLNFVPQFGKTYCANLIASRFHVANPGAKVVAVAHNDIAYKNLVKNLPSYVIVTTMGKLLKEHDDYLKLEIGLLIVDEIHKFTKGGIKILALEARRKLGLTGDKLEGYAKVILDRYGFGVIDVITEDEALANGWISEYVEYNLPVDLEEYKKDKYAAFTDKITDVTKTYHDLWRRLNTVFGHDILKSDLDLMFALYTGVTYKTAGSKRGTFIKPEVFRGELAATMGWTKDIDLSIDMNVNVDTFFNPGHLHEVSKMFGSIIRDRNDLIINSKNKIDMVLQILALNPVPTIIFNESTYMATTIADALGMEAIEYHSNVESKYLRDPITNEFYCHGNGNPIKFGAARLKKFAIEGINKGVFKYLCTAKALNESVSIPILQQVITTGGSTNPSTHNQRVGRGKTINPDNPSQVTKIINIYIKDFTHNNVLVPSRDASKLRRRQQSANVYWVDSIDEIFMDID